MTRLAIACYALAACALGLSIQVGWAAALVAVAALASAVALMALEHRRGEELLAAAQAVAEARANADAAREEVRRLSSRVEQTIERLARPHRGL